MNNSQTHRVGIIRLKHVGLPTAVSQESARQSGKALDSQPISNLPKGKSPNRSVKDDESLDR